MSYMKTQELQLSEGEAEALERIARENGTEPGELARLAVEALIKEAARNEEWIAEARGRLQPV